ncbi:MAG TPA: S8 family serine peptidase [Herpetosiphonaceae bacterium]|nr:S8 family serine peptidase [Herpetosiphonaceae bacterium]
MNTHRHRFLGRPFIIALAVLSLLLPGISQAQVRGDQQGKQTNIHIPGLLEIKFREGSQIRLRDGKPTDLNGKALQSPAAQAALMIKGIWSRSHDTSEANLDLMKAEGDRENLKNNIAEALPNLNLYLRFQLADVGATDSAFDQLQKVPEIEAVYRVPAPIAPPIAPDYYNANLGNPIQPYQAYQDAAPLGVGSRFIDDYLTYPGSRGTAMRICDVEYSWNRSHSDLGTTTLLGASPIDPFANTNHGTAVLGVYGGTSNGFGVTGIAYRAGKYLSAANTSAGYNVAAAITRCSNGILNGDVIVIEQQIAGPNYVAANAPSQFGLVPAEWYKPTYDAIKTATANKRIVVEAAGNGSQNLDSLTYSTGNGDHWPFTAARDSGAIIVGAGQSYLFNIWSIGSPHSFSNTGLTVDLQGWGDNVVTSGYGDVYSVEGSNAWYTNFAGTSAATPIVAGAVASVQGLYKQYHPAGQTLTASSVKSVLRTTGTPQGSGATIGPLPNIPAALDKTKTLP